MNDSETEIKLSYATLYYDEPIVYCVYKSDVELGFPEVKELVASAEKLSSYRPYVTLTDVRLGINITNEGRKMASDLQNMPLFRGTAVVVKNSLYKFAVNFASEFNSSHYPFRAFTSKEKAVKWLLSLPLDKH